MSDGGRIVNLATSILGMSTGYYAVYAGSKAPIEHFTRALAKELMDRGIAVNTIAPGRWTPRSSIRPKLRNRYK